MDVKVTKLKTVPKIEQKPWIINYLDKNTDFRAEASAEFDKLAFEKMNLSFFEK